MKKENKSALNGYSIQSVKTSIAVEIGFYEHTLCKIIDLPDLDDETIDDVYNMATSLHCEGYRTDTVTTYANLESLYITFCV